AALLILRQIGLGFVDVDTKITILLLITWAILLIDQMDGHRTFRPLLSRLGNGLVDNTNPCTQQQRAILRDIKIQRFFDHLGIRSVLVTIAAKLPDIGILRRGTLIWRNRTATVLNAEFTVSLLLGGVYVRQNEIFCPSARPIGIALRRPLLECAVAD